MIEITLGVIVVAIILYCIFAYNGLVNGRQMVRESWSGIDVQLKRRANLIPNLVETVKAYAKHENKTLTEVIAMRARVAAVKDGNVVERAAAESAMGNALFNLMAVAEQYPELKANSNFRELQGTLDDLENEIQMSRRYYNGTTRSYNVSVESFPSNLIANWFAFRQAEYFEIEEPADRQVPQVAF